MRALAAASFVALYALGAYCNTAMFDRSKLALERYQPEFVVLPRPEVVRVLSLGFDSVTADWYWIKAVNYFGDNRNMQVAYGELANYFELVTDLDPKFFAAYLFGGYALPWNRGDQWVNTREAAALLERGTREFPNDWRLRFQLAYIYSAYLHRYKDAGDQLVAASKLEGAPPYLGSLATRMYATTGDVQGAELLAQHLYEETTDPEQRKIIKRRLFELRSSATAEELTAAARKFREAKGHFPASLKELADSGVAVPAEPLGGSWAYDPKTGQVSSSVLNAKLGIFIHPRDEAKHGNPQ